LAKKSKTAKRGAPARKAKKKPAPVPIPPPPVWKGYGGIRNATPEKKKKKKSAPKPAPIPRSPLLKILGEDH
jgi:hypothetical protein